MAVRCLQCGTTLNHEAIGHSDAYKSGAKSIEYRLYMGYGSFLGAILGGIFWAMFTEKDNEYLWIVGLASAIGAGIGRYIVRQRWLGA